MGRLFQFPLSRGWTLWHSYDEQAFLDAFFNSPYQAGVLWHYMRNRHLGYLFQLTLSRGCTLWHSYEEQAFWDAFFNSPYQEGVVSGIPMTNRHFGMPFSIPSIKRLYSGII